MVAQATSSTLHLMKIASTEVEFLPLTWMGFQVTLIGTKPVFSAEIVLLPNMMSVPAGSNA
jgi:hypothetical protein